MLNDELSRLDRLEQSSKSFRDLYEIMVETDLNKAAALWIDDEGQECSRSFQQFDGDVRAAAALFRRYIGDENEGRFVALSMENRYQWPVAFWGLLMAGYKPLLLDVNHKAPMVKRFLATSGAVAIVGKAGLSIPALQIAAE